MRISGLSSGLDTEQLIKDIMTAERVPVDKVFQQKVKAEWKRDAYRDVNTKLLRLRNLSFDMTLQGTYQKNVATSSHSDLVSVIATGSARAGTYDLDIKKLATAGRLVVQDAGANFAEFEIPEEGVSFQLQGTDGKMETIKVAQGDTLESVVGKINANKNLGINAFYDDGRVSLTTKTTGTSAQIIVGDDPDGFFATVFGATTSENSGQNAIININGLDVERGSNTFDLNGITVNLHEAQEGTSVRIDVRHDVDAVVGKIKEFVDVYNELVDEFNLSTREEVFRDFQPLTSQQKDAMSDKEIEQWEAKAKSGLLRSDSLLGSVLGEMRMALGAVVQGLEGNKSLAQIGIKTGAWYEYGKLHLDEAKLQKAVEEDPEGVRDIFTKQSEDNNQKGLARRLTTVLDNSMKRITDTAGKASSSYDQSYLGEQIRDFEDRLAAMEERLIRVEQSHWRKFTAMEKVLSQLNAQSDWLYQQLMTMQG